MAKCDKTFDSIGVYMQDASGARTAAAGPVDTLPPPLHHIRLRLHQPRQQPQQQTRHQQSSPDQQQRRYHLHSPS